jgi:hypothetical protein
LHKRWIIHHALAAPFSAAAPAVGYICPFKHCAPVLTGIDPAGAHQILLFSWSKENGHVFV